MSKFALLVYTNAAEGRDDDFNEWYDNVHVPDVLGVDGIQAAQRYALDDPAANSPSHRYLAVYELESDDPQATMASLRTAAASMSMTDAMDPGTTSLTVWRALGERAVSTS